LEEAAVKTILFDFDGTIADTFPQFVKAVNHQLEKLGREPITEPRRYQHLGLREAVREFRVPLWRLPLFVKGARALLMEWTAGARVHKGMKGALRALRKKYEVIIVTSNSAAVVEAYCVKHAIKVDGIVGDLGIFGKARALRKLQKTKTIVGYVGDEVRDLRACRKVGMKMIAVTWGYNSRAAFKTHKPDALITSAKQLERM
jgi:phosphoglycolate phosphatase-like HAD superfamily hydrolase